MHSFRFIPALLLFACGPCRGEEEQAETACEKSAEEAPLLSPKKSFSIVRVEPDNPESTAEKLVFAKKGLKEVAFEVTGWPGFYYISPDDRWIVLVQSVGSGQNEPLLFRVEENGRVSQIAGFGESVWLASDAISQLSKKDLYHTGVHEVGWSADAKTLTLKIGGADSKVEGKGIKTQVSYNVATNSFQAKPLPGEDEDKLPEEAPLDSPGKSFSIESRFNKDLDGTTECVVFSAKGFKEVPFESYGYRGLYYISPDDRWILRCQKVYAGCSEAMLYRVEEDGRISQVKNFEDQVWAASDAVSQLKKKETYHTGVHEVKWSPDSKTLTLGIRGDGVRTLVTYDIPKKSFQAKPLPDDEEEEDKN